MAAGPANLGENAGVRQAGQGPAAALKPAAWVVLGRLQEGGASGACGARAHVPVGPALAHVREPALRRRLAQEALGATDRRTRKRCVLTERARKQRPPRTVDGESGASGALAMQHARRGWQAPSRVAALDGAGATIQHQRLGEPLAKGPVSRTESATRHHVQVGRCAAPEARAAWIQSRSSHLWSVAAGVHASASPRCAPNQTPCAVLGASVTQMPAAAALLVPLSLPPKRLYASKYEPPFSRP